MAFAAPHAKTSTFAAATFFFLFFLRHIHLSLHAFIKLFLGMFEIFDLFLNLLLTFIISLSELIAFLILKDNYLFLTKLRTIWGSVSRDYIHHKERIFDHFLLIEYFIVNIEVEVFIFWHDMAVGENAKTLVTQVLQFLGLWQASKLQWTRSVINRTLAVYVAKLVSGF